MTPVLEFTTNIPLNMFGRTATRWPKEGGPYRIELRPDGFVEIECLGKLSSVELKKKQLVCPAVLATIALAPVNVDDKPAVLTLKAPNAAKVTQKPSK